MPDYPDRAAKPQPDHIMLSISGDARHSMTVTWRTDCSVETGFVRLRGEGEAQWREFPAHSECLQSDISKSRHYWAAMEGLSPGERYIYSVGSETQRSAEFSFQTEPEDLTNWKFLLISDHQKNQPWDCPSYETPRRMIEQALEKYPDIRFIFTAGDNCDNGQNELQWNGMFEGLAGITASLPYMMTTGNHDNRGFQCYLPEPAGKFYLDHADFFDAQFERSYPQNGPAGFCGENYSFDYGNAHFLVMGINAPEQVAGWAYGDLRQSGKTWKLGAYHFPIYPVMPEGQNDDAYPWLRKPIEQGRLDVLFSGHEHSFARTYPMLGDELFDRPSQGVVHYIAGNGGANIYCSNARKVWHSAFYPQEEPLAMAHVVEIDGNSLNIVALLEDGRYVDVFCLDKAADLICPLALAPVYHRTKLAFKGSMLEFIARGVAPFRERGSWFVPVGVLAQSIGGAVEKSVGALRVALYGSEARFIEGSAQAVVDGGAYPLRTPVLRGDRGQLFITAEDICGIFGMKYQFAARNNFLNFDHPSENIVLSEQPEQPEQEVT
ncbi:MAG: metallophosphoesterase family protein [Oscillospiraceae bacterium]|nr:metallophosphoesterase family protein [Oscillospiraceae bacterium]